MKKLVLFTVVLFGLVLASCDKDEIIENNAIPQPPTAFEASVDSASITASSAKLSWTKSNDPDGTSITYSILLDGELVAEDLKALTYELKGLAAASDYNIEIVAQDGDELSTSVKISFATLAKATDAEDKEDDTEEEGQDGDDENGDENGDGDEQSTDDLVIEIEIEVDDITSNSADLSWLRSSETTDADLVHDIYLNEMKIEADFKSWWYDLAELEASTEYTVKIVSKAENGQSETSSISFTTDDPHPKPTIFSISLEETTAFTAFIRWTESTDPDGGVIAYDVYLDGEIVHSNLISKWFPFEDLEPETTYTAKVVARTENDVTHSETQEFTTTEASEPLSNFEITVSEITSSSAFISWDEVVNPNGGFVSYDLFVNGRRELDGWFNTQYRLSGLDHSSSITVRVVAKSTNSLSSEQETVFQTQSVSHEFGVGSVIVKNSSGSGTFTFDPTVNMYDVTGFQNVSSVKLHIGDESFNVNAVFNGGYWNTLISQAQYDAIAASNERTAIITYTPDGGSEKEFSMMFTVE